MFIKPIPHPRKRLATAAAVTAAGLAGLVAAPTPAHALGAGSVCMFNAPSGARGAGHVGWAFRNSDAVTWTYGATENPGGSPIVWAGGYTGSWSEQGTFQNMLDTFTAGGPVNRHSGFYTRFRCSDTPVSAIGAADSTVHQTATDGYDLLSDNCLTKALQIFESYDAGLRTQDGEDIPPNSYFTNVLSAEGWGQVISL